MMIPRKGSPAAAAAGKDAAGKDAAPETTKETVAASAPAATPAPSPAPASTSTAVAAAAPTAVAVAVAAGPDPLKAKFKDAVKLDWNTLNRVQANQGNFLNLEKNKEMIGSELVVTMLSFQDNFLVSPGSDDEEAKEHVRYSDDGKITTKGEPVDAYMEALREAGYLEAKLSPRCTIALAIEDVVGKPGHALVGELIQIDLPKTSKDSFDRFRLQSAFKASRGMMNDAQKVAMEQGRMRLSAQVVTQGKNSWTVVNFALA